MLLAAARASFLTYATTAASILMLIPLPQQATAKEDQIPGFVEVPVDQVNWQPHPAIRGAEYAVLLGKPSEAGPLIVRVRLPPNVQVLPHTHPEPRTYTVLAGEWKLGFGSKYEAAALKSYSAGSMYRLPAKIPHFQSAGPEGATVQIESIGPTRTDFIRER